ncbi:MAG: hypothetical protein QNJ81_10570 [Acidimicrobiia bacterium]|nr:hypothetical protein [Acidimicrobiia bacterium]
MSQKPRKSGSGNRSRGGKGDNRRGGGRSSSQSRGKGGSYSKGSQGKRSQSRSNQSGGRDSQTSRRNKGTSDRADGATAKKKLPAAAEGLPRHVVEALVRVTPPARQNAALAALAAAAEAFSDGQYHVAVRRADHAKDLASRDATIREILGLASYRIGDWATALRELRTYRRLSGETTHMPVEMDVLRAMGRDKDVTAVWEEFRKLGGGPAVKKEARVVYASFLIDQGDLEGAARIAGTPKMGGDPWPEDLRLWYVAARINALTGSKDRARSIADSILLEDPSFPGLDDLDRLIDAT